MKKSIGGKMAEEFFFEKEMLRMLEYALTNSIEITDTDIEKIKLNMNSGMSLNNDPAGRVFFKNMEIMTPKMSQTILRKGINYAIQRFKEIIGQIID